jgi:hypothetical protein
MVEPAVKVDAGDHCDEHGRHHRDHRKQGDDLVSGLSSIVDERLYVMRKYNDCRRGRQAAWRARYRSVHATASATPWALPWMMKLTAP